MFYINKNNISNDYDGKYIIYDVLNYFLTNFFGDM